MSTGLGASDAAQLARLRLDDDVEEEWFASPARGAAGAKHTAGAATRAACKQEAADARGAQLQAEREKVREVNRVVEAVTASLTRAAAHMDSVHTTVDHASALLATWTRILSQTEHNQRVILHPGFHGASQDLQDMEREDHRRQHEAERRVLEEQRRREEAHRKAEEEERRKAAAVAGGTRAVGRTRSVRGTSTSTRGHGGAASQSGRGRGTAGARGAAAGRASSTARGRGRGLG